MDKLLWHQPHTLERQVRDGNDDLVDIDSGNMVVTVRDGAGVTVTSGNATNPAVGIYQFTVAPEFVDVLDTYQVTWAWTQSYARQALSHYEVVGGLYFSVAEAREIAGMSAVSAQAIAEARERIEELIEAKLGRAFVPRARRVTLSGSGTGEMPVGDWFIRTIHSVSTRLGTVDTAYTAPQVADLIFGSRVLSRKDGTVFPYGARNITVHYEYGMDQPPEPVKRAALLMCQASFGLTDSEGNPTRPLSGVLTDIPEVAELLAPYGLKGRVQSVQIGSG